MCIAQMNCSDLAVHLEPITYVFNNYSFTLEPEAYVFRPDQVGGIPVPKDVEICLIRIGPL